MSQSDIGYSRFIDDISGSIVHKCITKKGHFPAYAVIRRPYLSIYVIFPNTPDYPHEYLPKTFESQYSLNPVDEETKEIFELMPDFETWRAEYNAFFAGKESYHQPLFHKLSRIETLLEKIECSLHK